MKKRLLAALAAALFLLPPLPAAAAADAPSAWAADAVREAIGRGLVPGSLQSRYQQPITRAQFCALAHETLPAQGNAFARLDAYHPFTDTDDENVRKMALLGVVNGKTEDTFAPDDPITRQEAAAMLYRMAQKGGWQVSIPDALFVPHVWDDRKGALRFLGNGLETGYFFPWAREAADFCNNAGIMSGVGDNCFEPNGSYTVEQSIVTMLRLRQWADAGGGAPRAGERRFAFLDPGTGLYGYKDAAGNVAIPAQFDFAGAFANGWAAVGVPDKGLRLLREDGSLATVAGLSGENGGGVFFSSVGALPGNYADVSYTGAENGALVKMPEGVLVQNGFLVNASPAGRDGMYRFYRWTGNNPDGSPAFLWGYISDSGFIIPAAYAAASEFLDGVACVQQEAGGPYRLIDTQGNFLPEACKAKVAEGEASLAYGRYLAIRSPAATGGRIERFDGRVIYQSKDFTGMGVLQNGDFYVEEMRGSEFVVQMLARDGSYYGPDMYHFAGETLPNRLVYATAPDAPLTMHGSQVYTSAALTDPLGDGANTLVDLDPDSGTLFFYDDRMNELGRVPGIEWGAQLAFEDGALRVMLTDNSIRYYSPTGRLISS